MTIRTSAGTTHEVRWIDKPIQDDTALALRMDDARRLSAIIAEFDGLAWIERYDELQGNKRYDGYTVLAEAKRMPDGSVLLMLRLE